MLVNTESNYVIAAYVTRCKSDTFFTRLVKIVVH